MDFMGLKLPLVLNKNSLLHINSALKCLLRKIVILRAQSTAMMYFSHTHRRKRIKNRTKYNIISVVDKPLYKTNCTFYSDCIRKTARKRSLGRPRRRRDDCNNNVYK